MAYQILIKESAKAELARVPKRRRRSVEQKIAHLADNPRPSGCKALKGSRLGGLYRVRSGDYRIIYQIQESALVVLVVIVGNRRDVYD